MTLSEILSNEELRRDQFPVVRDKIFLAHAAVCPLPRRVADAIRLCADRGSLDDQEITLTARQILHTRELAARLLHANTDEIALVGPTSLALSFVASGLPFRKGDNVLVYHDDYPSNVYPWMALSDKGVEVRLVCARHLGCLRPVDVLGQVDERTRLVALASCHFVAGWRLDVAAIGSQLRRRRIWFCVDAIQTLGAFPASVEHVDFLAADAHKWLLGPCGAGIFYVRKGMQDVLRPTVFGWHNVRCPNFVAQEQIVHPSDARRYEAGTANILGLSGLEAALELILEIGVDKIAAELLRKRAWIVPELQKKGCVILQPDAPQNNASAIISFQRPGTDLATLHEKLHSERIETSLRADRAGQNYIRLSPHFYNTDAELNRLIEIL